MSGAIMEKVWGMLGLPEKEEEETEELDYDKNEDIDNQEEEEEDRRIWGRRSNRVVNMPQTQQVKMVICQPTTFEQSESICNLLKEKKSIIVNLEYVNKDVARRIVYDITNEMAREEIKNKLSVSWLRNNSNN